MKWAEKEAPLHGTYADRIGTCSLWDNSPRDTNGLSKKRRYKNAHKLLPIRDDKIS